MTREESPQIEESPWLSDPGAVLGFVVLPALAWAAVTLAHEIPSALLTVFRLLLTL